MKPNLKTAWDLLDKEEYVMAFEEIRDLMEELRQLKRDNKQHIKDLLETCPKCKLLKVSCNCRRYVDIDEVLGDS